MSDGKCPDMYECRMGLKSMKLGQAMRGLVDEVATLERQLALATEALQELVSLQDYKARGGEISEYLNRMSNAWFRARKALAEIATLQGKKDG